MMDINIINCQSETIKWFRSEEFVWRSIAGGVWLVMMIPLLTSSFIFAINFSFYSPLMWLQGSLSGLFSLQFFLTCFLVQIAAILITIAHARSLDVSKTKHSNTLALVYFLLRPRQVVNLLCATVSFLLTTFLLSKLSNSTIQPESFVFSWPCSIVLALLSTVDLQSNHNYVATFPILQKFLLWKIMNLLLYVWVLCMAIISQQKRLFRVKKMVYPCFSKSVFSTIKAVRYFYLLYILIGIALRFASGFSSDITLSASIWHLLSIHNFWSCFCVVLFNTFLFQLSNELLKIFHTEPYCFPLQSTTVEDHRRTLSDAMISPLLHLKYLACLDYRTMSKQNARRQKMYELTAPGNQPHLWNTTSMECIRMLETLRNNLTSIYDQKQQNKFRQKLKTSAKNISTGTLFSPSQESYLNKRNITSGTEAVHNTGHLPVMQDMKEQHPVSNIYPLEHEDNVFNNLQAIIWSVEGLSNIVAASIREDKYGVVQKKLPDIIGSLLSLLDACDLYTKVSLTSANITSGGSFHNIQQNANHVASLKLALKTGVYTFTTAFGHHISSIRLSADHMKKLHAFLDFAQ